MKLKEKIKRLLVLGLAAGITINSVPLSVYAASGIGTELEMQTHATIAVETESETEPETETEVEKKTELETETETETETELESKTEEQTETEPEIETESEGEAETEIETETESETETETEAETETEVETETENETETETETETAEEEGLVEEQLQELETQAKEALQKLVAAEPIMALVYLCETYHVKAEPSMGAEIVASLTSGHTVLIEDVAVDRESMLLWYQVTFVVDDVEISGYMVPDYLAYSNENFLTWEEEYGEPIQQILEENREPLPQVYNNMAMSTYSSDVQQFPASYQDALQALKNKYPNWTFVKFNTGLNWNDVVANEISPKERSLVYYTLGEAWKNGRYDSSWYYASESAVEYCLDPRNGLTDPRIFQFELLTYNSSYHTVSAIQNVLSNSFMSGTVPKANMSYAQAFYNIGKSRNLSPFHLASRVLQEQGVNGSSPLISGTYEGYDGAYKGYYNYFNIGATSSNPIKYGLQYAKNAGWNTPYKSLEGGAKSIGNGYILKGQDTLYLQKFDVDNSSNGIYYHQYMQNIQAPTTEASTIRNLYNQAGALKGNFVFRIPVYYDMPDTPCPEPSGETMSLSASGVKLKGGYETTITYTIKNPKSSSSTLQYCRSDNSYVSVKLNNDETTSGNTIKGTVTITGLVPGETYVTFQSSGGSSAQCKITVLKDTVTLDKTASISAGLSDGTANGTPVEISYEINNPKSEVKSYTASNKEIVKVELLTQDTDNESNKITGKIRLTGLKPGKTTVTLKSKYGGSATCTVTVIRLPEQVVLETKELTVGVDNSKNAHATVLPEDTTNKTLIWTSADEDIATVNPSTGRITGVGVGTTTITVTTEEVTVKTGKPITVSCKVTVVPSVEGVEIAAEQVELSLKDGETFALNGKVLLNGAETSNLYKVEYASSDEEIVTVDALGVITPVATGNAVVTATVKDAYASSGTKQVACKVSVVPEHKEETVTPEYDYVQPETIQIYRQGGSQEVTENTYVENPFKTGGKAVLRYVVSPADADVEEVIWESSNPSVLQVISNLDGGGKPDGTVTVVAKTKGNVTLTAATDIGIKKTLNIAVEEKQEIEEIVLDKTQTVLYVNGTDGGNPAVAGKERLSSTVQLHTTPGTESGIVYQWRSTDESVAVVDEQGKVTAKAPGKTVIIAEDSGGSGKYAKCAVTVQRSLEEITTSVGALKVQPGKKVTVTANLFPADHTEKQLEWSSNNEEIVTVTQKGVVAVNKKAEAGDKAVITVTDHITGLSKEIPLTVTDAAVRTLVVYEEQADAEGNPVKAGAQTLFVNGTDSEQSVWLRAEALDAAKEPMEGTAFYATSSNTKVAEVVQNTDEQGNYDGTFTVRAKGKGSTNIKVFAADGSGKNVTVKVTVKVYPEQVTISKAEIYITPGGSGTMAAAVSPTTANDKGVMWKFAGEELQTTSQTRDGFTLNPKNGKVTVQKGTPAGTQAEFVAVSKSGEVESRTTCVVTVVSKKVSAVKLDKKSLVMTGDDLTKIPAEKLVATVAPSNASVTDLYYASSNENVVQVDGDGNVTAAGYGTANVTVSTLDNSKKAVCKVYVTSIDKAYKLSAVTKSFQIRSYATDINSSCALQIKDQYGNVQDNSLFTFKSSNPAVAQVDANGIVTPSKATEAVKNGKVTVTATLTGDPYKRKVTFTVNVLAKEQAETISVTAENIRGENVTNKNFAVKFPIGEDENGKALNTITLTAEALNVYGETLDTKLKWSVSDTSLASIKPDKDTKTAVLTVKKSGKFYVTCTANDTLKKSRVIQINAVDAKPVLENKKVTLNLQSEPDAWFYVHSDAMHFIEDRESPILDISVLSVKKGKTEYNPVGFRVEEGEEGYYTLQISEDALESMSKGNYNVVLSVTTKGMPEIGLGTEEIIHQFPITLAVADTKPKVSIKTATINRQNVTQLEAALQVTAPGKIENIEMVANQKNQFDTRFAIAEEDGEFRILLVDETGYKSSYLTGKVQVKVEGYKPVAVNVRVNTPTTRITLAPSVVPTLDVKRGREQKLSLMNKNTKEVLKHYDITLPDNPKLSVTKNSDGTLTIKPVQSMVDKGQYKNNTTVTVNAKVMAKGEDGTPLWKSALNVNISAKVYTSTPSVSLGATTLQLNRQTPGETVTTSIKVNRSNVRVADDSEWRIEQYNAKDKKYSIVKEWGQLPETSAGDILLSYNRQTQQLCAALKDGAEEKAGTYKYRITWIAEDYSLVKSDVTVIVVDKKPSVKITAKGKLDLLTREQSTMQGNITLGNTKGKIKSITMMEPVDAGTPTERNRSFYSVWLGDNSFRIKLRENVEMTTGKKTIPVKVVLEGGTVLWGKVTFSVSQSTPKVVIPKAQTIYKSAGGTTVLYDMNKQIPSGYAISHMDAVSVPKGIGVTIENGRISVSLSDRHLKPGTYSIKVNMYFTGAQDVFGSAYGKAHAKVLKVTMKE